ncbi:MAG TPA: hypothetical protein VJB87_00050 [Candidatus Nanoarchaeia archaeon]|nr:hypothetical protein [Candidatus Nanoarchaeia archaeon]
MKRFFTGLGLGSLIAGLGVCAFTPTPEATLTQQARPHTEQVTTREQTLTTQLRKAEQELQKNKELLTTTNNQLTALQPALQFEQFTQQLPQEFPLGIAREIFKNKQPLFRNGKYFSLGPNGFQIYTPGTNPVLTALTGQALPDDKFKEADLTPELKDGITFTLGSEDYIVKTFRTSWAPFDISVFRKSDGKRMGTSINIGHLYDLEVVVNNGTPLGIALAMDNYSQQAPPPVQQEFYGLPTFPTTQELAEQKILYVKELKDGKEIVPTDDAGNPVYYPVSRTGLNIVIFPLFGDGQIGSIAALADKIPDSNGTKADKYRSRIILREAGETPLVSWNPKPQTLVNLAPIERGARLENTTTSGNTLETTVTYFGNQYQTAYQELITATHYGALWQEKTGTLSISLNDLTNYQPQDLSK